jgi:hypothetical protein
MLCCPRLQVHKRLKAASTEVATAATDLGRSIKDTHAHHVPSNLFHHHNRKCIICSSMLQVHKRLKAASSEVATVATDLGRSIKDIHAQHLAAAEMAAREVRGAEQQATSKFSAFTRITIHMTHDGFVDFGMWGCACSAPGSSRDGSSDF